LSPQARRLAGRRAFVTGGGSGIGRAAALRLAEEGAAVAVCDKREANAREVADVIEKSGARALAVAADVGDEAQLSGAVGEAVAALGGLDSVFANAGTAGSGWIHETALADWEAVLRVNLTGVFLTAKHTLPHLMEAGGGAVVTTGSIASFVVGPGGSAASYAASKGGVLQLTKQIAVDYGAHGIRANCLCPGGVKTNIGPNAAEDIASHSTPIPEGGRLPRSLFRTALSRMSEPAEQAAVVAFLLSDDASFITGTAVLADGGLTAI
jgi:3-oxoacyl-[acyl-carrier protein] reductase